MVSRCYLSMMLVLFGLLALPVQAQTTNMLSCTEQDGEGWLKMVMSDVVDVHTCGNQEPPITFEDIIDRCDAFCAPSGIPIPVGTDGTGFNKEEIDAICMGTVTEGGSEPILRYDPELMANCVDWSQAVQDINLRAADFIASVTNMTFEQLVYRAAMADKVANITAVMTSDEVQEDLELARVDLKLTLLQDIIGDNLREFMVSGMLSRGLNSRLDHLERKAEVLMRTIDNELPKLTNFTEQCNTVLLGTGPLNEYALDICSVTSSECVESDYGKHVGCCCGIIPAVGAFEISASISGRRLQQDGDAQMAEEVDVCAKAAEIGAGDLQDTVSRLTQIVGGDAMLEAYDAQQRTEYPDYYDGCDAPEASAARRLDKSSSSGNRKPSDFQSSQKVPQHEQDNVIGGGTYEWMTEQQQRNLQSYLSCIPPDATTNSEVNSASTLSTLSVADWDVTEQALCKNIIEDAPFGDMTDERLASVCAAFCSPDSIPLMLGTSSFGFSQAQMDGVCLQPDRDGSLYNAATINECHESASVFTRLQDKTADFAMSLQVLDASRLRFQAYARNAQLQLKQVILNEAETTLDDASSSQKLSALQNLMRTALGDILGGNGATVRLQADALSVKESATLLREELAVAVPGLRNFLTNCNFLTTGVGPSQEYMLDMCSQTSRECIDSEEGIHVGCCCGYNPIITLGTANVAANTATIRGKEADVFNRRAAPAPAPTAAPTQAEGDAGGTSNVVREAPVLSPIIDICAKAYTAAKPTIDLYYEEIEQAAQTCRTSFLNDVAVCNNDLIVEAEQAKRERYADYYDRCTEPEERWTWSEAASSQMDTVRSFFSWSSPAIRACPSDIPLLAGLLFCVMVFGHS